METKSAKEEFEEQVFKNENEVEENTEQEIEVLNEEENEINFENLDENALSRANEEIEFLKSELLRVQADGENYKRRLEKDN